MINLTEDQFADALREAYEQSAIDSEICGPRWNEHEYFHRTRDNTIWPILRRSKVRRDDHGREVK